MQSKFFAVFMRSPALFQKKLKIGVDIRIALCYDAFVRRTTPDKTHKHTGGKNNDKRTDHL
jgi:hypothetical protein